MSKHESLDLLGPFDSLELDSELTLNPRVKLQLTVFRADKSVVAVDEWKLKRVLIEYLKTSHSIALLDEEKDVVIRKFKDLKKRKREDPVARGSLVIRDLGFLDWIKKDEDDKDVEKRFLQWRKDFVEKLDGMDLNLEGNKFKLAAALPPSDDFEGMKKEWDESQAFGNRGYSRGGHQPDTLVLRGVPSRWCAETRVSSKPSMIVTHTIFSALGKIRNLAVDEDHDLDKAAEEDGEVIIPGLQCKIVIRFEKYKDFHDALKILSGRSLHKKGSRMKADYEVTWDKDGYFENSRTRTEDRSRWEPARGSGNYRGGESTRQNYHTAHYNPDDSRSKRFRNYT